MKHLKLVLIALMTFGAVQLGQAQTKVAHISTQELLEAMPQYQDAMTQLTKLQNSYKSKLSDMLKEMRQKSNKYSEEAPDQTDEENEKRTQEIQDAQQRIQKYQQNAQKNMQDKQEELLKPILSKAKNAIEKVAKKDGYDYVLNSDQGMGVLVADGHDLLPEVKKELGI